MKRIRVKLLTRSLTTIERTIIAIDCKRARKLGLRPITEQQLATSKCGATFMTNVYLGLVRAGIKCAIVHTKDGRYLTVYREGVLTCEEATKRDQRSLRRHTVWRHAA